MNEENIKKLINAAIDAAKNAYAPYSHFHVGAAVLCSDGKIFSGCNVECASYPCGICAEKSAASAAVSAGYTKFEAAAVTGAKAGTSAADSEYCTPCGQCRQFLREFMDAEAPIYSCKSEDDYISATIGQLLPGSFELPDDD